MTEESLWFISENGEAICVFSDRDRAQEERFYLKEENPLEKYKLYDIPIDELSEYPDELALALQEDLVEVASDDEDYGDEDS